ncbi:HAD family hydrolase [Clostridium cellulovorans]|uniref:HAD-superfamily hydrolase, subfamily IA, variant 1 n=1 Tax=Clostridium cellulovorans (strain ATCC 35296 / DSM 3052 / OCM 3 / 743B) TaxID=573061 RepID=D9ST99_CLOC7|nr:HAD family hydrolase [Clostridium cellulovorans]ADL50715.1 HAD-superfamily hydrolase, subfamily IA, variant 1 [Clostridium cellulovorans 743B]
MKNIIFDVDGTLWDTTGSVAKSWNKAVSEVGVAEPNLTADMLKKEFGKPMNVIADDLFPDASPEQKEQLLELCCKYEHEDLLKNEDNLLFPGVKETIIELSKKYRLFIVSNCQCGYIELFMDKIGIKEYIEDYECFGNTGRCKGENIKLVVERNNLDEVVYVGDTQGDYEATVLAEVPFIFARYGFGNVENFYMAIDNIGELLKL